MFICLSCNQTIWSDSPFCEACGQRLANDETVADGQTTLHVERLEEVRPHFTWGTARLKSQGSLVLEIADMGTPIIVQPKEEIILGRYDQNNPQIPDVDFTRYGASEKGVSRRHAALAIQNQYVTLTDLGSANGTLLNGHQLLANTPRVVRNGDEIRLGKLKVSIYFAKCV